MSLNGNISIELENPIASLVFSIGIGSNTKPHKVMFELVLLTPFFNKVFNPQQTIKLTNGKYYRPDYLFELDDEHLCRLEIRDRVGFTPKGLETDKESNYVIAEGTGKKIVTLFISIKSCLRDGTMNKLMSYVVQSIFYICRHYKELKYDQRGVFCEYIGYHRTDSYVKRTYNILHFVGLQRNILNMPSYERRRLTLTKTEYYNIYIRNSEFVLSGNFYVTSLLNPPVGYHEDLGDLAMADCSSDDDINDTPTCTRKQITSAQWRKKLNANYNQNANYTQNANYNQNANHNKKKRKRMETGLGLPTAKKQRLNNNINNNNKEQLINKSESENDTNSENDINVPQIPAMATHRKPASNNNKATTSQKIIINQQKIGDEINGEISKIVNGVGLEISAGGVAIGHIHITNCVEDIEIVDQIPLETMFNINTEIGSKIIGICYEKKKEPLFILSIKHLSRDFAYWDEYSSLSVGSFVTGIVHNIDVNGVIFVWLLFDVKGRITCDINESQRRDICIGSVMRNLQIVIYKLYKIIELCVCLNCREKE